MVEIHASNFKKRRSLSVAEVPTSSEIAFFSGAFDYAQSPKASPLAELAQYEVVELHSSNFKKRRSLSVAEVPISSEIAFFSGAFDYAQSPKASPLAELAQYEVVEIHASNFKKRRSLSVAEVPTSEHESSIH